MKEYCFKGKRKRKEKEKKKEKEKEKEKEWKEGAKKKKKKKKKPMTDTILRFSRRNMTKLVGKTKEMFLFGGAIDGFS